MTSIPATLDTLRVRVDSLRPYGRNPRRGDVREIVRSLRHHGQYRPIVVNERTREVLAGNHTLEAAITLGWEEIAATFVDVDEDQAARIVLVDNRSNDVAGYDLPSLAELLGELPDLEGTGYSPQDLDELLAGVGQTPGKDTPARTRAKRATAKPGDLYVLGKHRLVCGDAADPATLEQLLERELVDLVIADPPADEPELLSIALAEAHRHAEPGAATYAWCGWRTQGDTIDALDRAGQTPAACIVWKKGRVGPGSAHYRAEHEFCLVCRPELEGDHELCLYCKGEQWDGGRGQSDVWEAQRDTPRAHPDQKPVAIAERQIENSTRGGGLVLDPFAGTGSTLLACENLNRRGRLVEVDPRWVDQIVERWERHTGRAAERQRAGT